MFMLLVCSFFFFFNDTATTEIYTLSLHDALPIFQLSARRRREGSHRDRDAPRLEAKRRDPLVRPPHRQSPQPGRAWHHAAGDRRAVPKLPHRAAPRHPRASRRALGRGPLPDRRLPPRRDSVAAHPLPRGPPTRSADVKPSGPAVAAFCYHDVTDDPS